MTTDSATATVEPELSAAPRRAGLWALVRESLRGARHDYTTPPLGRAIVLLAVPMVLEMVHGVGVRRRRHLLGRRSSGADAVATVGLTESMLTHRLRGRDGAVDRRDGDGRAAHRREGSRGRGARGGAGDRARRRSSAVAIGVAGAWFAPQLLRADGRDARASSRPAAASRVSCSAATAHRAAVPHQRRLPRRRRRGDRDARAVARQRHQHRARPVLHLRPRAVPRAGRHRRRGRDDHRPRHRRALPALCWRAADGHIGVAPPAPAPRPADDAQHAARCRAPASSRC